MPGRSRRTGRRTGTIAAAVLLVVMAVAELGVGKAGAVTCADLIPQDDNYTIPFGSSLAVDAPGLLANDAGTNLAVQVSWGPFGNNPDPSDDYSLLGNALIKYGDPGGLRNRKGGFTYTPDPLSDPFSGIDQFDYWVIDPCDNEDLATAYITVVPSIVDDHYGTLRNTPLVVPAASGFLANDKGVDASTLTYDIVSDHGGSVDDNLASDGSFTYTPPVDFVGVDSFSYDVYDLDNDLDYTGTVYVNVGGPLAPPSVVAIPGDQQATVGFAPADPNGSPITSYTVTSSPGGITATGASSPIVVGGLTDGVSYTFSVHATNAVGAGDESVPTNAVVPDDGKAPTVTMTGPASAVQLSNTVTGEWSGVDPSGIDHYDAERSTTLWNAQPAGWSEWNAGTAQSFGLTGSAGRTYCFRARAEDRAGLLSDFTGARCTAVPLRSDQVAYSAGQWTKATTSSAYAGFEYYTKTHNAMMTRTSVVAKRIALVYAACSTCGSVQVRFNNVVIANVNTARSGATLHRQVVQVANWTTARSGTLTATVTSTSGKTVVVEGLAIYNG